MNEKIDVLAVMDDAIGDVMVAQASGLATDISVPEMCAARAAIAELIEADREYDEMKQAKFDAIEAGGIVQERNADRAFQAARKRRARALAHVRGAK